MKKTLAAAVLLLVGLFPFTFSIYSAMSQTPQIITINQDGTVTPFSAPVQLVDGTYILNQNTSLPLVIKRDSTIFDGNGYTLRGDGNGTAVNLLCTNTTVRNLGVVDWQTGILSANNNTITQNLLTSNNYGVTIYAAQNVITANYIASNREGIHIESSSNTISQNQIQNNTYGVMDPGNVVQNTLTLNNLQNNTAAVCTANAIFQAHRNNFVGNAYDVQIIQTANGSASDLTRFWDDSAVGNYWSSHPNQTQFIVHPSSPQIIDRYPFATPFNVTEVSLPSPKPLPNPTTSPTPPTIPTASPETPTPIQQHAIDAVTLELALTIVLLACAIAVLVASRGKESPDESAGTPSQPSMSRRFTLNTETSLFLKTKLNDWSSANRGTSSLPRMATYEIFHFSIATW
jgi:parallel beta-helix repeat protein